MLGKHVIFPVSSMNYMFSVNYIIFLNITYVFAIITCLGFLVITSYTLYFNLTFFLCLNLSFVLTNYQPRQCNTSYNRAFIVVWSMTSKLIICGFKSPQPVALLILISQMTSSSVIIPYRINVNRGVYVCHL